MRAKHIPPRAGWGWIKSGFMMFRTQPGMMNLLWFGTWVILLVVGVLPWVGQILASMLMPIVLVVVMNACRAIDLKHPITPDILLGDVRVYWRTLASLGLAYLLISSVVFELGLLIGGESLQRFMGGKMPMNEVTPAEVTPVVLQLLAILQVAILASLPTLIAAPLTVWCRLPALKAVFFASVGMLRNWRALVVFYASIMLLAAGLPAVLGSLTALLPQSMRALLQLALTTALLFTLAPTVLCSFYLMIRDIFADADDEPTSK